MRLAVGVLLGATLAWLAGGCQFPDYRVVVEGGAGSPEPSCEGATLACVPSLPAGWRGPVAFWEGSEDTAPDCPEGYGRPQDVLGDLTAAPAECSCSCAASGETCAQAQVSIFNDAACDARCAEAPAAACAEASGCAGSVGSLRAPAVAPTGGSCEGSVEMVLTEPSWGTRARLCERSSEPGQCAAGQACVTSPAPPFSSQVCVYRVALEDAPVPSCPEQYPSGPSLFHRELKDTRACGDCVCEGPSGGSCEATVRLSAREDCGEALEYEVGSGCAQYQLDGPPTHVEATYKLEAGSCAAAGNAEALGEVKPAGTPWVVCCAE